MSVSGGLVKNGLVLQSAGGTPPTPTNRIFKALNGDLFISIDDRLFTSL